MGIGRAIHSIVILEEIIMTLRASRLLSLAMGAVCLAALPAAAATLTITLDDVTVGECGTVWVESECSLWFAETTADDYTPGFCMFVADANNFGRSGIYIWPGRLVVDLSGVTGLETVEVDIVETHFAGSTRARLYRESSQVYYAPSFQEGAQTLILDNVGQNADLLAISAHEAYVFEIRLIGDGIVPDQDVSFGTIKALYR